MSGLRWGEDVPADTAAARQRLIEAAGACIDRFGLAKSTLEDVAAEASVSRQTVYRYFSSRDELFLEALLVELQRAAPPEISDGEVTGSIRTPEDAVAALVEVEVRILSAIRGNPKLAALLDNEGDSVRATLSGASQLLFRYHENELRPWLEMGQQAGFLNTELEPGEMAEWLLRMTLSLMTVEGPHRRGAEQLREYLRTYLTPVLVPPG
ncbi:MAG: hypothetical protein JJLCMIEE_00891 [Acidimicrobiales bacterium]|nr:MAG: TetR/AcrR family transcriptional regulator [Actinomycetota bacterium]MBV6507833.1 hypothetical protein [Acidimicrobiales bacterium]RIK05986.1 MAG: hypothetical protein DCC48_08500 [Acidobacteriota bacterium]